TCRSTRGSAPSTGSRRDPFRRCRSRRSLAGVDRCCHCHPVPADPGAIVPGRRQPNSGSSSCVIITASHLAAETHPMSSRTRYTLLYFACVLSVITYIDRVCIASSAPAIRAELGLDAVHMGWIFSAFTFAYAVFEIPSGWMGDVLGPRKTLMRIVLWWSAFTTASGIAWNFPSLLIARFLFGAGEAGAYPNM